MSGKDVRAVSAWEWPILRSALVDSLRKLDPRLMVKNPVMFVVEVGSILTTGVWLRDLVAPISGSAGPPASTARPRRTAGRAAISSYQRLIAGYSLRST